jgi:tetratricopeptide (TPR) repeat protein
MTPVPDSRALAILANVVESGGTLREICMLASVYFELGEHEKALRYASLALEREPSSGQAREVLAKAHVALGDYTSASIRCGNSAWSRRSGATRIRSAM